MGRKLQDLTSADFPGADPAKFVQWQQMQKTLLQKMGWGFAIAWVGILFEFLVRGLLGATVFFAVFIAWMVYMLAHVRPFRLRADALAKEMGIDRAAIKRALSRQSA